MRVSQDEGMFPSYNVVGAALHFCGFPFQNPINPHVIRKNMRKTQTEGHPTKYPTSISHTDSVIKNKASLRNCHRPEEIKET